MRVVEAAREQIAFAGGVQREQVRISLARIPCPCAAVNLAVHEQIHLARKSRERRHHGAAGVILDDELRDKDRISKIGKRIIEALPRVHAAQRIEIGFRVFADEHEGGDSDA